MSDLRMSEAFRSIPWRIGRKLYIWARREASSGPETSGEYWLLAQAVKAAPSAAPCFLDIGARLGEWTELAQALLKREGLSGYVHAFEPSAASYAHLIYKFKSNESIHIHKQALSDLSGPRDFFVVSDLAGVNSLTPVDGATVEQVDSVRVDDFLEAKKIDHVLFAKCDAEGHDFNILRGASELFRQARVDVWQFEYNHRWLASRAQLKDVFDFIADKPYRLGNTLSNFWVTFVPRILWPQKPVITQLGSELHKRYFNDPNQVSSSLAPTYSAEAYWNLGPAGVVLVSVMMGLAIGWLTHYSFLAVSGVRTEYFVVAFSAAIWACFVESWLVSGYLGEFVIFVVVLFSVRILIRCHDYLKIKKASRCLKRQEV